MDVPDPVTEEWLSQAITTLSNEELMQAFVIVRDRGQDQAQLVAQALARHDESVAAGAAGIPPVDATVVDATVVGETRISEPSPSSSETMASRPAAAAHARGGELAPGTQFAGCVIEGIAGRGGMGVVHRAREHRPSRIVALKVISPELADDTDFRERFERESEITASIEHSNVIPVYDVGEESGLLYIAMRYVEGTDLRAVIEKEGRLEPHRAVHILGELTSALDAAHARGLVHRDVKPANVLIAHEGAREHVYLTDFGLAKLSSGSSQQTRTGLFVGTLDYAAPEQIEGKRVDARTDVYAVGCLLYQMLTGVVPFPKEHDAAIMMAHMSAPPGSIRDIVPGLPEELDEVIGRAMAKRPHDRYQSAGDLGRDAAAAIEGQPAMLVERSVAVGRAAPASAAGQPPREGRSPGTKWFVAGLAVVIVALAAVAVALVSSGSSTKHPVTTTQARVTPRPPVAAPTKAYSNAKLGVSFRYPAVWQPLTLAGAPADFGTGGSAATETRCALEIERGQAPAAGTQESQFALVRQRSAHAANTSKHYDLRAIQSEQGANIEGVGLLRVADGQGGHLGFFFKGRDIYVFDCITPGTKLTQVDRTQFAPLLRSVRIG